MLHPSARRAVTARNLGNVAGRLDDSVLTGALVFRLVAGLPRALGVCV